ncbi:MAG: flavodoxin family protein [Clostridiales bacterium]|jgi:multimeric flavodoxin WrbA|nr:flavodoxin family protein [Clostridiales bacterium]
MSKVLMVNGGPHKAGCTYTALREAAGALEKRGIETEICWLGNEPVAGCAACGACRATGRCCKKDAVNLFLDKAEKADGFVFGSPVHFASATGAITSFMDRAFYAAFGAAGLFFGKPTAAIVTCRRGGATAAFDQLNKYFTISGMPVVSSKYWNMAHGNTPDEVKRDLEGMQVMRALGENMAWLLKCIEAGKAAGVPPPEQEQRVATNFIR